MNLKKAAKQLGLKESEYRELVQLFVKVSNTDLENLKSALQTGDTRTVFEASHSIKGAALNLGFQEIAAAAAEMELNARHNCLDGSERGYAVLKGKIENLAGCLAGAIKKWSRRGNTI